LQGPKLHIVSFDVPYPADYGGAIDVYYKIKSLAEAGCEIYLHCFAYGREQAAVLENLCKQVWYYPRLTGWRGLSLTLPYMVYSRRNSLLLQRLLDIDAPILFEGIHCTFHANHPGLKDRVKLLRAHNVEHDYYKQLAQKEKSFLPKLYYSVEAHLLRKYEQAFDSVDTILCISQTDANHFAELHPSKNVQLVSAFHPFTVQHIPIGMGRYCLYHGNLQHPENNEAVVFLLSNVIPELSNIDFIIAGRNPSQEIKNLCEQYAIRTLFENPGEEQMNELVMNAHIHVLPTFQRSGIKLKLLYALFGGRHVIANEAMLYGNDLADVCHVANTADEMIQQINHLADTPFTETMRKQRMNTLGERYDNAANAQRIITCLQRKFP